MDWNSLNKKVGLGNLFKELLFVTQKGGSTFCLALLISTKPWPHEKGIESPLCFLILGSNLGGLATVSPVCSEVPSAAPGPWGYSVNAAALDGVCICLISFNHHHLHPVWFIKMPAGKAVYQ